MRQTDWNYLSPCVISASVGALGAALLLAHDPPDCVGAGDLLGPGLALGLAAAGIPLALRRWNLAMAMPVVLAPGCAVVEMVYMESTRPNAGTGWFLLLFVTLAAIAGLAAYALSFWTWRAMVAGALAGVVGMSLVFACTWLTDRLLTSRSDTDWLAIEGLAFFGPVMGMCLALPARYFVPRSSPGEEEMAPHCAECDCNLTGNVSGICPKCGTPIPIEVQSRLLGENR